MKSNYITQTSWTKSNFDYRILQNSTENKLELLEYVLQKYDISDAELEDNERFQSILREIKIEELINE